MNAANTNRKLMNTNLVDTKTRLEKARATRIAKAAARSKQQLTIGDWTIQRADDMNWEVRYKDAFHGYFGRLEAALQSLPEKILTKAEFADVYSLLYTMQDARILVLNAINEARKLSLIAQ